MPEKKPKSVLKIKKNSAICLILISITTHVVTTRYSERKYKPTVYTSLFICLSNNLIMFYDKTTPNNKVLRFVD